MTEPMISGYELGNGKLAIVLQSHPKTKEPCLTFHIILGDPATTLYEPIDLLKVDQNPFFFLKFTSKQAIINLHSMLEVAFDTYPDDVYTGVK
jgi:hypothetical protein